MKIKLLDKSNLLFLNTIMIFTKFIKKIPSKYLHMIFTASFMCAAIWIRFCVKYHYSFSEYIYFPIIGALLGALFGCLIASIMWAGERLGVWTVPIPGENAPPIRWLKILLISLSVFVILALIAAYFGVV